MFFNVGHIMLLAGIALGSSERSAAAAPPSCTSPSHADADVHVVIDGMFSVDHIGPSAYDAIVTRVRAEPSCHVAALVRIASGLAAAPLSSKYPTALLELVTGDVPAEARDAVRALIALYQRALLVPPSDDYQRFRIERSIQKLAALLP